MYVSDEGSKAIRSLRSPNLCKKVVKFQVLRLFDNLLYRINYGHNYVAHCIMVEPERSRDMLCLYLSMLYLTVN